MAISTNLGFPRIGAKRELKRALESYWKGDLSDQGLEEVAVRIRKTNWQLQKDAGINLIPSNDFSYYDQMLDMVHLLGAVPERFALLQSGDPLALYFACARGSKDIPAMEMTKWFDTNYHYIVPELTSDQKFALSSEKPFKEYAEAKELSIETKPVIIGPVTFLKLSKVQNAGFNSLDLLSSLLPVYNAIITKFAEMGASWLQIDEPVAVLDLNPDEQQALKTAYTTLLKTAKAQNIQIKLTTYFGALGDNIDTVLTLPVDALHIDLVRGSNQLNAILTKLPEKTLLSLGVVDGRNIWKNNFDQSLVSINKAKDVLGSDRLMISPSCSLLHSPVDLDSEEKLDKELLDWLAFAKQKVEEIVTLTSIVNQGEEASSGTLEENRDAHRLRSQSERINNEKVKLRLESIDDSMLRRQSVFEDRHELQQEAFNLPLYPTTTIGSFPQTTDVRQARAKYKRGEMSDDDYTHFLEKETVECIRKQEALGIDVLVHGEFERNDMVEYFGEQLDGFAFTQFGWVQSYGSRCVKPPIIYGDVQRQTPMTVKWSSFAQSKTEKLMKGMLTGPVTILQWSFVRDDQPRSETCNQIALAIRDEVRDLALAGIKIIQIDEAALREGLPLRKSDWAEYLQWAVDAFKLASTDVEDAVQIHTHMCYSEFNDIIEAVAAMDADVISIETSRSHMELLSAFVDFKYPNDIGPGVYDIHSPRIPSKDEMLTLLRKAADVLPVEKLWVNPDCGLKTRRWEEVEPALASMVEAAADMRKEAELKQAS